MQFKLCSRRAVSPLISTLLIMVTSMMVLSVTLNYVNGTLTRKNGEIDFEAAKIFMKNVGLQIDDVAWTSGRVDTVHFTSNYGQIEYLQSALTYTLRYYNEADQLIKTKVYDSTLFMYNIPTNKYYLEEGYYYSLLPSSVSAVTLYGANSPATRVFVVQNSNVGNAEFLRIAVIPVIRIENYTVSTSISTTKYVRLYLPQLQPGYSSDLPKSIVLSGLSTETDSYQSIKRIEVEVDFPRATEYYDNQFFRFPSTTQTITFSSQSNVEMYLGFVKLDYGP